MHARRWLRILLELARIGAESGSADNRRLALRVGSWALATALFATACGGADDGSSGEDPNGGAGDAGASSAGSSGWPSNGGSAGTTSDGGGGSSAEPGTGGSTGEAGSAGAAGNDCPRARVDVAAGATLNVRPDPSTANAPVGTLPNGAVVDVVAQVQGESVGGDTLWFQIATRTLSGYISSAFAACTTDEPPVLAPPGAWYLPLECGKSAKISQGNFGNFSHSGKAAYAFDFSLGVGTKMVAMADGIVHHVYDQTGPGDPCYDGGGSSCYPYANLVVLLHGDGSTSIYKHLSQVLVSLGAFVARGTAVGLSGSTGYSTGPHAHVMRQEDCGQANCQSIPLVFADVPGDGVPDTGQTVTSGNCP
jgi:murein DD-endopeptidase MepM/ murein hydrolase activator NlpD